MISLPGLFLALAGTALVAALVALWNSARSAFGGGPGVLVETAHDLPDHAQLLEEKHALLRAIKDLEYERAVGKIGDADFQRLDGAYRARAKQVLAQLDRDVKPLYAAAEKLLEERLSGKGAPTADRKKKRKAVEEPAVEPAAEPESEGPGLDEVLDGIRAGTIETAPEAPAHWPADAKKMWASSVARAIAERDAKRVDATKADAPAETPADDADAKKEDA